MADSLATLIKLMKTHVDEQRQLLAKVQAHLAQIEYEITELEIRQATEQLTVQQNPDMALTYGDFVRWAIERARELETQRQTAAAAVELARDKLSQLFEEQKRYELAAVARDAEERREELKRENDELNEIGSVNFMRNKGDV